MIIKEYKYNYKVESGNNFQRVLTLKEIQENKLYEITIYDAEFQILNINEFSKELAYELFNNQLIEVLKQENKGVNNEVR